MTTDQTVAVIGTIITAAIPGVLAWLKSRQTEKSIGELHILINSRLTELLKASAAAAHAEGNIQGRDQERTSASMKLPEPQGETTVRQEGPS